ncbi:MAG: TIGR04388 family protein, partial [Leptospiraceae bacterium]|nr:TIGR04388 family protein [Leptospiraceae bacterium]
MLNSCLQFFQIFLLMLVLAYTNLSFCNLKAEPIVPDEIQSNPSYSWDDFFQTANQLRNLETWNIAVEEQFYYLRSNWEKNLDQEISLLLSQIQTSDVVHSTDIYIDYVARYLESQKQEILASWETESNSRIWLERAEFVSKLESENIHSSENKRTAEEILNQAEVWSQRLNQIVSRGQTDFQNTLTNLDASFDELMNELSETDYNFQLNKAQIESYENSVRESIQTTYNGMKQFLFQTTLLHKANSTGVYIYDKGSVTDYSTELAIQDFQSIIKSQMVEGFDSNGKVIWKFDSSKLSFPIDIHFNEAGKNLIKLVLELENAHENKFSLTEISKLMATYLTEQAKVADEKEQDYLSKIYHTTNTTNDTNFRFLNNGSLAIENKIMQFMDTGRTDSTLKEEILKFISARALGGSSKIINALYDLNLDAITINPVSNFNLLSHHRLNGNYVANGISYKTYDADFAICWVVCGVVRETHNEEFIHFYATFQTKDLVAEQNAKNWADYESNINLRINQWNSQVTAIQNWETQSSNYQKKFSEWEAKKLTLVEMAKKEREESIQKTIEKRNSWMNQIESIKQKAINFQLEEIESLDLKSIDNDYISVNANLNEFKEVKVDNELIKNFFTESQTTLNGAYNIALAHSMTIFSESMDSSYDEYIKKHYESQREMKDNVPEHIVQMFKEGGECTGDTMSEKCKEIYNGNEFFKQKYRVTKDTDGNFIVSSEISNGRAKLKEGGNASNPNDYITETEVVSFKVYRDSVTKLVDTSSLGGLFSGNWLSKESAESTDDKKVYLISGVFGQLNTISKDFSERIEQTVSVALQSQSKHFGEISNHFYSTFIRDASAKAEMAGRLESLAMAIFTGGLNARTISSWANGQVRDIVKSAIGTQVSRAVCPPKATTCQASELLMAFLQSKHDANVRRNAERKMEGRSPIMSFLNATHVGQFFNNQPLKNIKRAIMSGEQMIQSETALIANQIVNSDVGRLVFSNIPTGNSDHRNLHSLLDRETKNLRNYITGKDLAERLNAGRVNYKAMIRNLALKKVYAAIARSINPNLTDKELEIAVQLIENHENRIEEMKRRREKEQQIISTTVQVAIGALLQFIPVAGNAAGTGMISNAMNTISSFAGTIGRFMGQMGQVIGRIATTIGNQFPTLARIGSTGARLLSQGYNAFTSGINYVTQGMQNFMGITPQVTNAGTQAVTLGDDVKLGLQVINGVSQAAITSSSGNDTATGTAFLNGLLLGATGPLGLAGSVSYTPPQRPNTVSGLLNQTIDGSPSSGYGGSLSIGGSIFNAGVSFTPGSGTNINLGFSNGSQTSQSLFGNISYNLQSQTTSNSIGIGNEYGNNISLNFGSNSEPSVSLGTNDATLTFEENGNIILGVNALENEVANVSYDASTGVWSEVQLNQNWGSDWTIQQAQNQADQETGVAQNQELNEAIPENSDPFNTTNAVLGTMLGGTAMGALLGLFRPNTGSTSNNSSSTNSTQSQPFRRREDSNTTDSQNESGGESGVTRYNQDDAEDFTAIGTNGQEFTLNINPDAIDTLGNDPSKPFSLNQDGKVIPNPKFSGNKESVQAFLSQAENHPHAFLGINANGDIIATAWAEVSQEGSVTGGNDTSKLAAQLRTQLLARFNSDKNFQTLIDSNPDVINLDRENQSNPSSELATSIVDKMKSDFKKDLERYGENKVSNKQKLKTEIEMLNKEYVAKMAELNQNVKDSGANLTSLLKEVQIVYTKQDGTVVTNADLLVSRLTENTFPLDKNGKPDYSKPNLSAEAKNLLSDKEQADLKKLISELASDPKLSSEQINQAIEKKILDTLYLKIDSKQMNTLSKDPSLTKLNLDKNSDAYRAALVHLASNLKTQTSFISSLTKTQTELVNKTKALETEFENKLATNIKNKNKFDESKIPKLVESEKEKIDKERRLKKDELVIELAAKEEARVLNQTLDTARLEQLNDKDRKAFEAKLAILKQTFPWVNNFNGLIKEENELKAELEKQYNPEHLAQAIQWNNSIEKDLLSKDKLLKEKADLEAKVNKDGSDEQRINELKNAIKKLEENIKKSQAVIQDLHTPNQDRINELRKLADKKLREQGLQTENLNRLDALNQLGNEVKFNAPTNVLTEAQVHTEMDAQRSKLKEAIKEIKVDGIGQIKVDKDFQILDNNGNELSREQKKNV